MLKPKHLFPLALIICAACSEPNLELTEGERAAIAREVDSATAAFADAERARHPARIMAHISPNFYMYNDGVRANYGAVFNQVREMFPTLLSFETTWDNVEVTVLGRDHAMTSFVFRDRVTLASGDMLRLRGPTTLVWERSGPDWVIIYADSDHYPDSLP